MAAYNPAPSLLETQLRSIREQTYRNWRCVISDDCSSRAGAEALAAAVGDDPRFTRLAFTRAGSASTATSSGR